ncbi:hypothetical protein LIER_15971 [Lithospermum erythrorhizon]|uniref:Uncharacterized protein n=1 Tax=Lithospermum erythrorhizon TaxID=34254 RepID=A0AAV3Q6C3_LITER
MAEYRTLLDSTTVEWVAEEAFRMKEEMENAPEGFGNRRPTMGLAEHGEVGGE